MSEESIRRLGLGDVVGDDRLVDRLFAAGETLFVERKQSEPNEGFGPTVAAFANTLGGWLLIGVDDDGQVVGWKPPGRGELQDWLRHTLRTEVDPLPPFAAATVTRDGHEIGIVRVAESSDTPHVVSATGALHIREPGGKRRVADHRELLELARRGRDAEQAARDRWGTGLIDAAMQTPELPLASAAGWVAPPMQQLADEPPPATFEVIVYGMPLTVTGRFTVGAISDPLADAGDRLAPLFADAGVVQRHDAQPRARGAVFTAEQPGLNGRADLAVDSAGVVAARWAFRRHRGVMVLEETRRETLVPLVQIVGDMLVDLDGFGRAQMRLEIRGADGVTVQAADGQIRVARSGPSWFASADLPIPAEMQDREDLVGRWLREFARWLGFPQWENPSADIS